MNRSIIKTVKRWVKEECKDWRIFSSSFVSGVH